MQCYIYKIYRFYWKTAKLYYLLNFKCLVLPCSPLCMCVWAFPIFFFAFRFVLFYFVSFNTKIAFESGAPPFFNSLFTFVSFVGSNSEQIVTRRELKTGNRKQNFPFQFSTLTSNFLRFLYFPFYQKRFSFRSTFCTYLHGFAEKAPQSTKQIDLTITGL